MYDSYELSQSEMITNITIDEKRFSVLGIYNEHIVYVSADVVKFGEKEISTIKRDQNKSSTIISSSDTEVNDNLEIENSQIMKGFLEYKPNQNLKKGSSVIFKAGSEYYKGKLKYRLISGGKCYIIDVFSYNNENKIWEKSNKSDISIPSNIIIGYKL